MAPRNCLDILTPFRMGGFVCQKMRHKSRPLGIVRKSLKEAPQGGYDVAFPSVPDFLLSDHDEGSRLSAMPRLPKEAGPVRPASEAEAVRMGVMQ